MKKKDMEKYQGLLRKYPLSEAEMKFIVSMERRQTANMIMCIMAAIVLTILIVRYYL